MQQCRKGEIERGESSARDEEDFYVYIIVIAFLIYFIPSLIMFIAGIQEQSSANTKITVKSDTGRVTITCYRPPCSDINECDSPFRRIDYVYPAYHLGCWLGEIPNTPLENEVREERND